MSTHFRIGVLPNAIEFFCALCIIFCVCELYSGLLGFATMGGGPAIDCRILAAGVSFFIADEGIGIEADGIGSPLRAFCMS